MAEGSDLSNVLYNTPRVCGECSLCCKVFPVDELQKPAHSWCKHFAKDVGCSIHAVRPNICRGFKCEWLRGNVPEELSPRNVNAVLVRQQAIIDKDDNTKTFIDALFVACDTNHSDAYQRGHLGKYVYERVRVGEPVFVVTKQGSKQLKMR